MMLYKNTKAMVHSPNEDTDFFEIVDSVLEGDTLAPYLFILCLVCVIWTSIDLIKENGFTIKKGNKQISCKNYDRLKQRRWPSTSHKYTSSNPFCIAWKKYQEALASMRKENTHVLTKRSHLHFKWQTSNISGPVHITWQQYLIYWKWCQCTPSEGMEFYWSCRNLIYPIK